MKPASMYYGTLLITRKVFFYGLLTIIPYYWFVPGFPSFEVIFSPEIIWSILFLGVVASMLCFLLWNWVIRKLGAVVATNWVYFNPVTTIFLPGGSSTSKSPPGSSSAPSSSFPACTFAAVRPQRAAKNTKNKGPNSFLQQ